MARRSRLKTKATAKRWPPFLLIILLLLTVGAAVVRLYQRQLINLVEVWKGSFEEPVVITADGLRGTIFDRNYKELAQTLERVSLYARPREVINIPQAAEKLSPILGISESEIVANLEHDSHLVWLGRDIDQADEELVTDLHIPGVYFHREFARSYPAQEQASRLIGYSENDRGLAGVEYHYDRLLNQDVVRQADLPFIDLEGLEQTKRNGHDLVLTLDMKIQAILEEYVARQGRKMGDGKIASLLVNAEDGRIIAGANYPGYNLGSVWQDDQDLFGSLFFTPMLIPQKVRDFFLTAAQLQQGWEQDKQVYPWSIASRTMDYATQIRLWDRLELVTEVDVDFAGGSKKREASVQFVDCVPQQECGTVPRTATPLNIALAITHLVNGGHKVRLHILDRIIDRGSHNEFLYNSFKEKGQARHVLPSLVSEELRASLKQNGQRGVLDSFTLAGDSVSLIPEYSGGKYVCDSMAVTVITGVKPELVLLMASRQHMAGPIEHPDSGAELLVKEINTVLPSMVSLHQVYHTIADMVEAPAVEDKNFHLDIEKQGNSSKALEKELETHLNVMPELEGYSLRKALRYLQQNEVVIRISGSGHIVSQEPAAGEKLSKGSVVYLELASDVSVENVRKRVAAQE